MRKCSSLLMNEQVIFKVYSDIYKEKIPEIGSVINVNNKRKTVAVCYLDGYKSRTEDISYEDMLAVYNPNGVIMQFNNISGPSDKLIAK